MTSLDIDNVVEIQREYFETNETHSYDFRLTQLKKLQRVVLDKKEMLAQALISDLGRPEFEAYFELVLMYDELKDAIKHLKKWMKATPVKTNLLSQPAKSRIEYCPLGNVLVIVPFNYPVILAFQPLIGAIAAGNTVVIKLSELTPATSAVIAEIIADIFDSRYVCAVEGGVEESNALLTNKFDHIFFTGSPNVGKIVMSAAAKHLTPVTLELGGKSPTIVNKDCKLDQAVKRILSGRFLNAGQTCIAPDHVYVHQDIKEAFLKEAFLKKAKETILSWYGESPIDSKDLSRIINNRHFNRIKGLIKKENIVVGGQTDENEKFIAPTLLNDISIDDDIMQQEIFGPVLPVLEFSDLDDVCKQIRKLPQHPLAMYIFTNDKPFEQALIKRIRCGGVNVNNTLMHVVNSHLPFGGVGESGMGSYHGKKSFELFSHSKSIIKSARWIDIPLRYPPYKKKVNLLKMLFR